MRQTAAVWLMLLWGALLAAGCGKDKSTNGPPEKPAPLQFTKTPAGAPVISSGAAGWPIFPTDPGVIKDSEGYHLFYTTLCCNSGGAYYYSWDAHTLGACDITDVIGTVCYAFSADGGLTWEFRGTPVVLPGPKDWQRGDLETPQVALLGDTLYLFYSALGVRDGQPFENRYQVGGAILDLNGVTIHQRLMNDFAVFEKRPEPLLPSNTATTAFDNNTQEPSVVIRNGQLELFYVGIGFSLPDQNTSAPGQEITGIGLASAVFDTDLNLMSNSDGYMLLNANIIEVKYAGDKYHLFATGAGNGEFHKNETIDYYSSTDGITWSAPQNLLAPGAGSAFDNWGIMAPTVVIEDDSIVMFYTGWHVEGHECFPEPFDPSIRFGRPSDDNTMCVYGGIGRAVSPRPETF